MKKYIVALLLLTAFGCKYDKLDIPTPPTVTESGYPTQVGNILVNKCATSGCHNSLSRGVAGGLDFSTWDQMFDGGRNGTALIPYSVENSYLLYSVNTDSTLGPILLPTMPYLGDHISSSEYSTLVNWIANGAPNKDGFVKFSDDPNRKKLYICMQACDKVAVIDQKTKVIMRYITVGANPTQFEGPHQVRVSPDGQYWYVVFISGDVVQKFRTSDDSLVGQVNIGTGAWNTIIISPDGTKGFANNTGAGSNSPSSIGIDLNTMTIFVQLTRDYPHGGFITPDGHYLYLTSQTGNTINKTNLLSPTFDYDDLKLYPDSLTSFTPNCDPHEMILSPDGSKYFVSCQNRGEVRVFQTSNDSLIKILYVGTKPQEFTSIASLNKVYVTCTEAFVSSVKHGLVYSIDCNTFEMDSIYTGFQPHGIAADESTNLIYVANLNYDPNGPAPHHVSSCSGRNGNLTIIDANTFTLYNKQLSDGSSFQYKCELLPFPYFVSIRN